MKLDPAGRIHVHIQGLGQMPGDGFPFTVRVGCQINFGSVFGFLADLGQDLAPAVDGDVFDSKIVVHIHAQLRFGHIPHMALRGLHLVTPSQEFGDGAGLGGRFHDNQFR